MTTDRCLASFIDLEGRSYRVTYDDGGRAKAGFKGRAGDCAVRAIAIATGEDYTTAYGRIKQWADKERPRNGKTRSSPRNGVYVATMRRVMAALGWQWTPTMGIGTGCTVHLNPHELPQTCIARVSKHYVAIVSGEIRDTHNSARDGTRCVYGYWTPEKAE